MSDQWTTENAETVLYDEATSAERRVVEQHLTTCEYCSNELSGLAGSRSAVSDWYSSEFKGVPTPEFVFPKETAHQLPSSWTLSNFFSGWRLAASALAAAAILAVFGTVYFLRSGVPVTETAVEVIPAFPANSTGEKLSMPDPGASHTTDEAGISRKAQPSTDKRLATKRSNATISNSFRSRETALSPTKSPLPSPNARRERLTPSDSSVAKRKTSSPSLTGFEEKEDETLRLEDLFSEIDAS